MSTETTYFWLFLSILPVTAFLYSSIGHGGASGYLALMSLFSIAPETMKPTALLLNICVAGISFVYYYRAGHFNKKLFLYVAIASIPMAFLGGLLEVDPYIYKRILGAFLIITVLKITNVFGKAKKTQRPIVLWQCLLIGASIGFLSGLIGIGGGIILSPIILLLHWGSMKEAAAVSALFIWVNSIAGLTGQFTQGITLNNQAFVMVLLALLGGIAGSYFGSKKMSSHSIKYVLAVVLLMASLKLFLF